MAAWKMQLKIISFVPIEYHAVIREVLRGCRRALKIKIKKPSWACWWNRDIESTKFRRDEE